MLARTPAPWTSSTGPFSGGLWPWTLTRFASNPSRARNGTIRSVVMLPPLQNRVGEPVGERRDRQARVRPDRPRHHRAVRDIEARHAERLAPRVDDALVRVAAHRAAAQRVHGDDLAQPPQRVVLEAAAELVGERLHRVAQALEVRL